MISRYEIFSGAIASMYHDVQRIERVEMAKYGLKGPHAQCLLAMLRHPLGITSAQLCEICAKDKAAISRIVSELEKARMIRRESRNGNIYRAALMLTEQGRAAADAVSRRAKVAVEAAGAGLNDAQREVFYQVLSVIADNLHSICKHGLKEQTDSKE